MTEQNPNPNPNPNQEPTVDIQAEIEKARKQERDKLHSDIEKLKADLAEKVKACNENYLEISNLQKNLAGKTKEIEGFEEKLVKAKEDGKMEANQELESLKKELEDYKAKLAKAEKDFSDYKTAEEVKSYRMEKIKDIEEEFKGLVKGNTKEEIDASYEQVKALQDTVKEKYSKQEKNPLPTPKTNPKKPLSSTDLMSKLANMSMDEYKEMRKNNFKLK